MRVRALAALALLAAAAAGAAAVTRRGVRLDVPNGARVKTPDALTVYFVDEGRLRPVTYRAHIRLWRGWEGIGLVSHVPESLLGEPLKGTSRLVKTAKDPRVWLIDNEETKRSVQSLTLTGFASSLVQIVEPHVLDDYFNGDPIE